ncbi:unnamed protein product, partial [Cyprideis torosa]
MLKKLPPTLTVRVDLLSSFDFCFMGVLDLAGFSKCHGHREQVHDPKERRVQYMADEARVPKDNCPLSTACSSSTRELIVPPAVVVERVATKAPPVLAECSVFTANPHNMTLQRWCVVVFETLTSDDDATNEPDANDDPGMPGPRGCMKTLSSYVLPSGEDPSPHGVLPRLCGLVPRSVRGEDDKRFTGLSRGLRDDGQGVVEVGDFPDKEDDADADTKAPTVVDSLDVLQSVRGEDDERFTGLSRGLRDDGQGVIEVGRAVINHHLTFI